MFNEEDMNELKRNWPRILDTMTGTAAHTMNGQTSYICPLCDQGTKKGYGLTFIPESDNQTVLHCFGCGFSGDIIALYQAKYKTEFRETVDTLAKIAGVDVREDTENGPRTARNKAVKNNKKTPATNQQTQNNGNSRDFTAYYEKVRQNIEDPRAVNYLNSRSISVETAKSCGVGFDPAADPAESGHKTPRLIFATSSSHYVARRIDNEKNFAKLNNKGGKPGIFNEATLYKENAEAVFVTEGVFDALSIIEVGAEAIAINSTSNTGVFLSLLEKKKTNAILILCLDNDEAGTRARDTLRSELPRLGIDFVVTDICNGSKDANEALCKNKEAFINSINEALKKTSSKPDNVESYIDKVLFNDIKRFKSNTFTGFMDLDKKTGGLYSGLYILAASSSLGKTTLALQIADNIAKAGTDVLFFSLEQSRFEMVTKSIARESYKMNMGAAVSSLLIRKGNYPASIQVATQLYKQKVKDRMNIIEGNFNTSALFIGDYVRRYIRKNNSVPVVFVDYLQVLQPNNPDTRLSIREQINESIFELKRLSRDLDITIVVISSLNRSSYLYPFDFESLKESGELEYTADVIFGLQLAAITIQKNVFEKDGDKVIKRDILNYEKKKIPRKLELVCIKNRYGSLFESYFEYNPVYDYFENVTEDTAEELEDEEIK